nr:PREDICTED: protein Wnt-11b-like [Opisthocomus hoazin]
MAAERPLKVTESQNGRLLAGLVPDQFQMCRRNLEVMPSIVRAARQTQSICQKTFADMRWNCSSVQRAPRFGPDLLKGPRESAFVYALAAAAVTPSIVVSDSLDTKCKCHGVSGSCSVKTCWKGLPDLEEIASDLKSKYLAAIKVTHRLVGPRKQLIPKETDVRPVRETDLVYLINSPDYCTPNLHLGSLGTQDRGRGYNTYTEEVVERCHCKYHWCCYVVCKKCRRKVERHVCK